MNYYCMYFSSNMYIWWEIKLKHMDDYNFETICFSWKLANIAREQILKTVKQLKN